MRTIIFALIPLILSIGITPAFADQHGGMSPYQQIKNGVSAYDVVCKSDLQLMIRPNGNPACVKEDSIQQLAESMAWGFVATKPNAVDVVEEIESGDEEPEVSEGRDLSVELSESIGLKGN